MIYHVNRLGHDLGVCSLEQLQARRITGEFTGGELVWAQGMKEWAPIDSVLPPGSVPRPKPAPPARSNNTALIIGLVVGLALFVLLAVGVVYYEVVTRGGATQIGNYVQTGETAVRASMSSGITAATTPINVPSSSRTYMDARARLRDFERRQFLEGYKLRGDRNPETDAVALQFLTNWIERHYDYGPEADLSLLAATSDQLAHDTNCTDPVVLTVSGISAVQLSQGIRRLKRAGKAFENSRHLGYPRLYSTVILADKVNVDRDYQLMGLDARSLLALQDALGDGSILPDDQLEVGEMLIYGLGKGFFSRNAPEICKTVKSFGTNFEWLSLTLDGEREINTAWSARGGGYANTVTQPGWAAFGSHLASARTNLTQAWNLRPDWAPAPSLMIYVSLGDSNIDEMRIWFDRAVAAQIDYPDAWQEMRWGLRPRWYGDTDSMLAFGLAALNTKRFDTDVPRIFYDAVHDVEEEMQLPAGKHIIGRNDIWPHFVEMYEGYIGLTNQSAWNRDGWRTAYALVAYMAHKYDVARQQLEMLRWKPHAEALAGYGKDLTLMSLEVAARTGSKAGLVAKAETMRGNRNAAGALDIYKTIADDATVDDRTRDFARDRVAVLSIEKRLHAGQWAPILPTDGNFRGWAVRLGQCKILPDGALEVQSAQHGHMLYSRVHAGRNFEARGQFEVVSSTTKSFQAGLVMGMPEPDKFDWFAFRIKRNPDEGDVAVYSQAFSTRAKVKPAPVNDVTNTFDFTYQDGRVTAIVNGVKVFDDQAPLENAYVQPVDFLIGLGAFNNSNETTVRYRNVEMRELTPVGDAASNGN